MAKIPKIRVNTPVPFPTLVQGSGPVTTGKKNGVWSIGLSYGLIPQAYPPPANWPTDLVLVWDSIAQTFVTVSLSALVSGSSSVTPPTPTTLGGVFSNVGATHKWVSAINTDGSVALTQPAFADISGSIAAAQMPLFGSANAGAVPASGGGTTNFLRADGSWASAGSGSISPPAPAVLGGVFSNAGATSKWIKSINTDGSVTLTQPSFADISGAASPGQIPVVLFTSTLPGMVTASGGGTTNFLRADGNWASVGSASITPPAPAVLGGVFSNVGAANKWISAINTDGSVTLTQPAAANISGLGYFATGTDAANLTGTINNARLSAIPNTALANSSITISGHVVSLGGSLALANTDVSGLGTFATQNFATPPAIGGTTPAAGAFTTLAASGIVSITNATVSSSKTTGALVVTGGVGISGSLYAANTVMAFSAPALPVCQITNTNATAGDYCLEVKVGSPANTDSTSFPVVFLNGDASVSIGNIARVGGSYAIAYNTSSDIRAKPNRELLSLDLARQTIDALKIWDFDKDGNQIRGVGVLAQEAYAVSKYFATPGLKDEEWWSTEKAAPMPYVIANLQQINDRMDAVEAKLGMTKP